MAVSDEYNMEGRSILSGKREKICFPFSAKNHTQELKHTHTHKNRKSPPHSQNNPVAQCPEKPGQ